MKVLVYPHDFAIGGSQINAIDLAADLVSLGHDAIVYGPRGPLVDYVAQRGLRYEPAATPQYRPAPQRITEIARLARREGIDVIHAYEWPPCLDSYYGAHLFGGIPLVCTVLSMSVSPLVPPSVPLIMGTEELGREASTSHRAPVYVMEPPIDVIGDHPGIDGTAFRREHGIAEHEVLVVTVSRLATELKLDALQRAIDAVAQLAKRHPVRLVVVGDGEAAEDLGARAAQHNARAGRTVISLPGALMDPRPAYAAADIVVGMGSSALRAMAIGKPVVVQGDAGFSLPCTAETLPVFLDQGFYGYGDAQVGVARLVAQLEELICEPARRASLGQFSRALVVDRFALRRMSTCLVTILEQGIETPRSVRQIGGELATVTQRALRNELRLHLPAHKRTQAAAGRAKLVAARQPS